VNGQWIGMLKANLEGKKWIEEAYGQLRKEKGFLKYSVTNLLDKIASNGHKVDVIYTDGNWLDVNSIDDIEKAVDFTR
ncbi:MAG TPA: phosphoenolpyruvate mutase, partial [Candidatus Omnitrophota bacterium]|nr:phosphoenolpyruvate mutase [Candidatus Omnitrophota bacterium]